MTTPEAESDFEDKMHRCANAVEVAGCVMVAMIDGVAGKELILTGDQRNTLLYAIYEAQDRAAEMRQAYSDL